MLMPPFNQIRCSPPHNPPCWRSPGALRGDMPAPTRPMLHMHLDMGMDMEPARPEDKLELSMDDKLARAGGFGLCQWLTSSTAFCAWVVHGAQVMSMAYIGPAAAAEFVEDATLVRLNGSLFFLGWLFGVGIWGQLAARHGWLRALGCVEVLVAVVVAELVKLEVAVLVSEDVAVEVLVAVVVAELVSVDITVLVRVELSV